VLGGAGSVSRGAGIFSPHPLHRTTELFGGGGPWNMRNSIREEKEKFIHTGK
jgi:hypothetical protein